MNYILSKLIENQYNKDIILVTQKNQYSYQEVYDHSTKMHRYLRQIGVQERDTILIAFQPGIEFIALFYASIMIRAKLAIVDPHMGHDLFVAKVKQLQPQWAFCDSRLLLLQEHPLLRWAYRKLANRPFSIPYQSTCQYVSVGSYMPIIRSHHKLSKYLKCQALEPEGNMDDNFEFFITYTSGTLQEPKGVVHSLSSLTHSLRHISQLLVGSHRIATALPHFALIGICAGLSIYMWDEKYSASNRYAFIEKNQIDTLFGPPVEYQELLNYAKEQNKCLPASLRHIVLGSAPVRQHFLSNLIPQIDPQCKVTCLYGMTENLVTTSCDGRAKINAKVDGDLLGKPLDGVSIKIDQHGEIMVKSPQQYIRYFHNTQSPEWHETGDLGKIDEKGNIILTGRKKDMIIRRNFNIYPALYEPSIEKMECINQAVMLGIYDKEISDEKVILIVEPNGNFDQNTIIKKLTTGPHAIDPDALPDIILSGKILRKGRQQKIDRRGMKYQILKQIA